MEVGHSTKRRKLLSDLNNVLCPPPKPEVVPALGYKGPSNPPVAASAAAPTKATSPAAQKTPAATVPDSYGAGLDQSHKGPAPWRIPGSMDVPEKPMPARPATSEGSSCSGQDSTQQGWWNQEGAQWSSGSGSGYAQPTWVREGYVHGYKIWVGDVPSTITDRDCRAWISQRGHCDDLHIMRFQSKSGDICMIGTFTDLNVATNTMAYLKTVRCKRGSPPDEYWQHFHCKWFYGRDWH